MPRFLLSTLSVFLLTLHAAIASASDDTGALRANAAIGVADLLGDPGSGDATAFAYKVGFGYRFDPRYALDFRYLANANRNVNHSDLGFDLSYYFDPLGNFTPFASLGIGVSHNSLKSLPVSGDAPAVDLAGGFDCEFAPGWSVGPELRLQLVMPVRESYAGRSFASVDNAFSVLVRVLYAFDFDD